MHLIQHDHFDSFSLYRTFVRYSMAVILSVVLKPIASASPGKLLIMQILRPRPRSTELETLGVKLRSVLKSLQCVWWKLKFEAMIGIDTSYWVIPVYHTRFSVNHLIVSILSVITITMWIKFYHYSRCIGQEAKAYQCKVTWPKLWN